MSVGDVFGWIVLGLLALGHVVWFGFIVCSFFDNGLGYSRSSVEHLPVGPDGP